jgi:quinol monooxygenase YgiN
MAEQDVRINVDLTIHEGKVDEVAGLVKTMIACSQKEPGTLGFDWYLGADGKRCRLVETYADANAVLAHLTGPVIRELVPILFGLATLSRCEVYGDPGPKATEMLAGFGAEIFPLWQAFGD